MMAPKQRGCRRPYLSAAKGASGKETTPPMVCMLTISPRGAPRGWLKSVNTPGISLGWYNREYDEFTPGKLSKLTFLPSRNRLDPVEHAGVETTHIAREERNKEEQVQFYQMWRTPP